MSSGRPAAGPGQKTVARPKPRLAPAIRRPRWPRVLAIVAIAAGLLAGLGYAVGYGLDAYRASVTLTGLTADATPIALTVAGEALAIPGNMIRDPAERSGDPLQQVDLVMHWPTLDGYSRALASDFTDGSPSAPLVYATIAGQTVAVDPPTRLRDIYALFFTGDPLDAPGGLTARRLSLDSGYDGDIVYYGPPGPDQFVARCLAEATAETPATCLRDINFGENLTLIYRFNRDIIGGLAGARCRHAGAIGAHRGERRCSGPS